jgi:transporter family-2 protein
MKIIFILIAALSGVTSALQSGSNATLQKSLTTPLWTVVFVSVITASAALMVAGVASMPFPTREQFGQAPWWAWMGGVFGLTFVLATVFASPKLGAGLFVALIVTASTVTSLVLDHFGLMSFDVHVAGIGRIAGALLMIAGVACIAAF